MFESLTERLETAFKKLKGEGKITEINVAQTLKEVRTALVKADVNYAVAKNFTDTVKQKALGQNIINAVKPQEMMAKIVYDELTELMGGDEAPISLEGKPAVILMSGLQGSGKTTFSGKLAKKLKKQGRTVLLAAGDVYRPAAIEQLKVLAQEIDVPVYTEEGNMDPVEIAIHAVAHARQNGYSTVIIDTAGRLAVDEQMMDEIAAIKAAVNPSETLFVVDSMTGQDAVNTAREFNNRLDFDGVILTKLDGDTRGGAAVSIRTVVNKPIKFVGSGEKLDDITEFNPAGMASRILGQGDLVGLAKRAQELIDADEAKRVEERILKNKFDFDDFRKQIHQIKKMGNIKDLAMMIPGLGKALKDVEISNDAFKPVEAIIDSMTPAERSNPKIINNSRRQRIAKGSGTSLQEVNRLLKQFEEMRKMMRTTASLQKNPMKMMQALKQQKNMQNRMR